jgi:ribosomal protein S18 acetylase RimI-like enzyme
MTTFHSDVPLEHQPRLEDAESGSLGEAKPSPTSSSILIRVARPSDLNTVTEILVRGFHQFDGAMGWMYPLIRLGIQEDLRGRLRANSTQLVCLVAYEPTVGDRPSAGAAARFRQEALKQFPLEVMGENFQREEQLMGTLELGKRSHPFWQGGQYGYISNLAVGEGYRRRGVAAQLLCACEKIALSWGVQELRLHVLEDNTAARQLYAKLGYGIQKEDISLGAWLLGRSRQMLLSKRLTNL